MTPISFSPLTSAAIATVMLLSCAQEGSRPARSIPVAAHPDKFASTMPMGCSKEELSAEANSQQQGLASYYHDSLAGNLTASGVRYRLDRLTAAHRKLPFGTRLRVTRSDSPTAPVVCVTVNDRGPFAGKNRIVDLSRLAAEELKMMRAGIVPVTIEILPTAQGKAGR